MHATAIMLCKWLIVHENVLEMTCEWDGIRLLEYRAKHLEVLLHAVLHAMIVHLQDLQLYFLPNFIVMNSTLIVY